MTSQRFLTFCSLGTLAILVAAYIYSVVIVARVYYVLQDYRSARLEYYNVYQTLLDLKQMESGQRGYLLTGDPLYLMSYNDANKVINTAIDATQATTQDSTDDARDFSEAKRLITQKRSEMLRTIELEQSGSHDEAVALVMTDEGLYQGVDASTLLGNILDRQSKAIQQKYDAVLEGTRNSLRITFYGSIFGVLLVIGNFLGMRFFMDATRKAEAQTLQQRKEVEKVKEWYWNVTQSSTDAFVSITPDGIVTFWNHAAENIFGYTSEEMVGHTLEKIIPPDLYPKHEHGIRRLAEGWPSHVIGTTMELQGVKKDGSRFPLELLISVWASESDGKMYTATIRDVSERKRYEEALIKSNGEMERFTYIASHDLQEPLRMVTSYLQLLDKQYTAQLDDKAKKYIGYAVSGSQRMRNLIQDLLLYSRVTSKTKEMVQTNLNACVDSALDSLQAAINESHAEIERDQLPSVSGDPIWLTQVFQNLLANSIKFRKPGVPPNILIRCTDEHSMWRIDISDNGIGFDMQYSDKIFVVFQKLHRKEEYEGTGIGLSICKKVIEQHGGTIWATSVPDKGSVFSFTLPKYSK